MEREIDELFRGSLIIFNEKLAKELNLDEKKIKNIIKISKEPVSLETPVGDSEDTYLKDFIEDENEYTPVDAVVNIISNSESFSLSKLT